MNDDEWLKMMMMMMTRYLRANAVDLEVSPGGECSESKTTWSLKKIGDQKPEILFSDTEVILKSASAVFWDNFCSMYLLVHTAGTGFYGFSMFGGRVENENISRPINGREELRPLIAAVRKNSHEAV